MVKKGDILISEPYLGDPNFERTVILICEHNDEGTFGFVLNKPSAVALDSVMPDIVNFKETIYVGGPVGQDSLHFIHRNNGHLQGAREIMDNLYWGGNFEEVKAMIQNNQIKSSEFRFLVGYSGWGIGQLKEELEKNSWIIGTADSAEIFDHDPEELWRHILKNMGGKYKMFSNYPVDPRLN